MLKKMIIYACNDNGNQDKSKSFTLQVNPTTVNVNYKIEYSKEMAQGTTSNDFKFNRTIPGSLSFKVVFDDTGIIDTTSPGITTQINQLLNLCYYYKGDKHEPNKLVISWGELYFKACLNSVSVTHKLFSPEGKPLRAELDLNFGEYIEKKEAAKINNTSSPDMTHLKEFKQGDLLPSLCKQVYKNPKLYLEIARINKLTDFRNIKPGTRILLPPLK